MVGGHILVVDDSSTILRLVKAVLAKAGYDVDTAASGDEGMTAAHARRPDLILLDILLPDLDGLSICNILRRQPATKNTPIIFMSALSGEVTRRTVAMNGQDFFTKPFDWNRLEKRIPELLPAAIAPEGK